MQAGRKSSNEMNWNNHSQTDLYQNLVQSPMLHDDQWMPDPHLNFKSFVLHKPLARLLSLVHDTSVWVSSSSSWHSGRKHGPYDILVAILLQREQRPGHDINELIPQHFPVCLLLYMSLVINTDHSFELILLVFFLIFLNTLILMSPITPHKYSFCPCMLKGSTRLPSRDFLAKHK